MKRSAAIIIPFYNEERFLNDSLENIFQEVSVLTKLHAIDYRIILVDDGSVDRSPQIAEDLLRKHSLIPTVLITHESNYGKGAALKSGINYLKSVQVLETPDWVVFTDADLEYHSQNLIAFSHAMIENRAELIVGNRFSETDHSRYYLTHYFANLLISWLSSLVFGKKISDIECGLKAIRWHKLKELDLQEQGFGIEIEIIYKLLSLGINDFNELPVRYQGRAYHEGKKINYRDGVHAIYLILKYFARGKHEK